MKYLRIFIYFSFMLFISSILVFSQDDSQGNLDNNTGVCIDCKNNYIKNGCFECYYILLQTPPNYYDDGHSNAGSEQFYKAIGCYDMNVYNPNPKLSENRFGQNNDVNICNGWYSPTVGTPNYFNSAFKNNFDDNEKEQQNLGVPINRMNLNNPPRYGSFWNGNQELENGYVGIYLMKNDGVIQREFIQQKLKNPLSTDSCYFISFDVSVSNNDMTNISHIGAYLSNGAPYSYQKIDEYGKIDFSACGNLYGHVSNDQQGNMIEGHIIKPQIINMNNIGGLADNNGYGNWVTISGYLRPYEECNYITIGCFEEDIQLLNGKVSAYYIDNVIIEPGPPVMGNSPCVDCCENLEYYLNFKAEPSTESLNKYKLYIEDLRNVGCKISAIEYQCLEAENTGWKEDGFDGYLDKFTDIEIGELNITQPSNNTFTVNYRILFNNGDAPCDVTKEYTTNNSLPPCSIDYKFIPVKKNDPADECCYALEITNKQENTTITRVTIIDLDADPTDPSVYKIKDKVIDIKNGVTKVLDDICFEEKTEAYNLDIFFERKYSSDNSEISPSCSFNYTLDLECSCSCSLFGLVKLIDHPRENINIYINEANCCCYPIAIENNTECTFITKKLKITFLDEEIELCNYSFNPVYNAEYDSDDNSFKLSKADNTKIVISNDNSIVLGEICLPNNTNPTQIILELQESYEDLYYDDNNCTYPSKKIECQVGNGCDCDNIMFNYNLIKKERQSELDFCCYDLEIYKESSANCPEGSVDVYVSEPSMAQPKEYNIQLINGSNILNNIICYDPNQINSSKTITVEFDFDQDGNIDCTKNISFNVTCDCLPCNSINTLNATANQIGTTCCYNIFIENLTNCNNEISKFTISVPSEQYGGTNNLTFSSSLGSNVGYSSLTETKYYIPISNVNPNNLLLGKLCAYDNTASFNITLEWYNKDDELCGTKFLPINPCINCSGINISDVASIIDPCLHTICIVNNPTISYSSVIVTSDNNVIDYLTLNESINYCFQTHLNAGEVRIYNFVWYNNLNEVCSKSIEITCPYPIPPDPSDGGGVSSKKTDLVNLNHNEYVDNFTFRPNPANAEATISFDLLSEDINNLQLGLYGIDGREISEIPVYSYDKGTKMISIDVTNVASGSYYLVLIVEGKQVSIPVSIVK